MYNLHSLSNIHPPLCQPASIIHYIREAYWLCLSLTNADFPESTELTTGPWLSSALSFIGGVGGWGSAPCVLGGGGGVCSQRKGALRTQNIQASKLRGFLEQQAFTLFSTFRKGRLSLRLAPPVAGCLAT